MNWPLFYILFFSGFIGISSLVYRIVLHREYAAYMNDTKMLPGFHNWVLFLIGYQLSNKFVRKYGKPPRWKTLLIVVLSMGSFLIFAQFLARGYEWLEHLSICQNCSNSLAQWQRTLIWVLVSKPCDLQGPGIETSQVTIICCWHSWLWPQNLERDQALLSPVCLIIHFDSSSVACPVPCKNSFWILCEVTARSGWVILTGLCLLD